MQENFDQGTLNGGPIEGYRLINWWQVLLRLYLSNLCHRDGMNCRSRLQKPLDSYQEEDLAVLREKWSDALMRRRQYLDQQIQRLINKQGESAWPQCRHFWWQSSKGTVVSYCQWRDSHTSFHWKSVSYYVECGCQPPSCFQIYKETWVAVSNSVSKLHVSFAVHCCPLSVATIEMTHVTHPEDGSSSFLQNTGRVF
jgi:hypothetical protein